MATGDLSQGLIPDLPRDPQIIDRELGTINPVWSLFFDQLILVLQTILSPEGTVMPQQSSTNVALLTAAQSIANILYNNTTNNFEGNINNPTAMPAQTWLPFAMITTNAGSPVGTLAGVAYNFCWDTTDSALYICTVTGAVGVATWVLV
jgi:hypothetical protein